MFDGLRKAFSSVSSVVRERTLSERELDELAFQFQLTLIENDVAQSVAEKLTDDVKKALSGTKIERSQDASSVVRKALLSSLETAFASAPSPDVVSLIRSKNGKGEPFTILFLGINGTGKTTTIAKFANLLKKEGIRVVAAAGDTHRPGAIEQLTEHAGRIAMKVVSQRYGSDPAAVGRDGLLYAKAHHLDCLLI
ncbi:MAG: signal recognition particle receptor subunit alpha, partial [Nitrososphaerota archaeon]|nr:signal recognition particle receptor subunit alpha [Nitrososphaerota archaeon]